MDEAKSLEADLVTKDEEFANRVRNREIKPQFTNGQDPLDGSLPKQLFKPEDGSTSQHHVQEDGPIDNDDFKECNPKGQDQVQEDDSTDQHDGQMGQNHVHESSLEKQLKKSKSKIGDIDTASPFESVKDAVSMFSGIADWKAHKNQIIERRKRVAQELKIAHEEITYLKKKSQAAEETKQHILKMLDNAKRHVEEMKLNLESAQTDKSEVQQDAELIKLRLEEMDQGILVESSLATKAQLEVAQARHQTAVSDLKTVKLKLENLQKEYILLVSERDLGIKNAEEAVFICEKADRYVEELTIKQITTKEALETAHGAYLEAEEHRIEVANITEQEILNAYDDLKRLQEEWENICQQTNETEDLNSKLDAASDLLQHMETELASYTEKSQTYIQSVVDIAKIDLKELNLNIEKTKDLVSNMKAYADSLKSELEQEKAKLITTKHKEWTEEAVIACLEADLMGRVSEVVVTQIKENEEQLEKGAEEANEAKSRARKARRELKKAKKAAKEAKKREHMVMSKLNVAVREVEAARASERLAYGAISAVNESEAVRTNETDSESENITISVQKLDELSQKVKEAEDEGTDRVSEAISKIDLAKESEVKAVKKLEQVIADLDKKNDELSTTRKKEEKATKGKFVVEQEFRIRRSEKQKEKEGHKVGRKKKKRSLIHRFCMFLCNKEGRNSNK